MGVAKEGFGVPRVSFFAGIAKADFSSYPVLGTSAELGTASAGTLPTSDDNAKSGLAGVALRDLMAAFSGVPGGVMFSYLMGSCFTTVAGSLIDSLVFWRDEYVKHN